MTSESTKSASGSKKKRRFVEFRPIERDDLQYLWAAYREGALDELHAAFEEDLSPDEFKELIAEYVDSVGAGWTFFAETDHGFRPVGFAVAWVRGRIIEIANMVWFPWASKRNIWESSFNFFDSVRKRDANDRDPTDPTRYFTVLEYARWRDKRFFERMCDKGVMRKVGQLYGLYPDETAILFQTRSPVRR